MPGTGHTNQSGRQHSLQIRLKYVPQSVAIKVADASANTLNSKRYEGALVQHLKNTSLP
jgi:hypothetical protein